MSKKSKPNGPEKMKAKKYEKELRKLQARLCHLQDWVKQKGLRVIIVFEGRDAAGKGAPSGRSPRGSALGSFEWRRYLRRRTARNRKCISSVTWRVSRPRVRS
jgi:Polyphosphate kinase 2 (PPK2)